MADKDGKTPAERVNELHDRHLPFWKRKREFMAECSAFYSGDRYVYDGPEYNRDRRLIQIVGQEIQDTTRHIVAQATSKGISMHAKPIDREEDPADGELAAQLVQLEFDNPYKGFKNELEQALLACRKKSLGIIWASYVAECGEFGEIIYGYEKGERYMWDPAYANPHHPLCGWLIRERRIHYLKAREDYGVDWIVPDKEYKHTATGTGRGVPLQSQHAPPEYDDECATIRECWYKNDKTTQRTDPKEQPLKNAERYLACANGCGYRSETEGELQATGKLDGELPDTMDFCPGCDESGQQGTMQRIDAVEVSRDVLQFRKGKRLIVTAPYSPAPGKAELYDGGWPLDMRSFPGCFLTAYAEDGDPIGPNDTFLMWHQQLASDQMQTHALQAVLEHRSYWILPGAGITDYRGQRFAFRDDQRNVMYRDASTEFGDLRVERVDGSGLDPQFPTVYGMIQGSLTRYRGISDISPEDANTQSGVAIAQRHQIGEIPTAHFVRRKNDAIGQFAGPVWDMIRQTYTPERLARMNIEGADPTGLRGDDMPGYDFFTEDTPEFTGMEQAKADATKWMAEVLTNPALAPFFDIFAEANSIPESLIRKVAGRLKKQSEAQDQAAQEQASQMGQMGQPGPPGPPDGGAAPEGAPPSPEGVPPAGVPQEMFA